MATVAIIHAAEDALPARALAEKLRTAKLTVVLERQAGDDVRAAVKDAKVTVALWSPRAIGQQALADDVAFARGKSKLVHAVMQNAQIPDAFRSDPAVNLTGWRGEDDFPAWRELAQAVTSKAGVAPLPPPTQRPPSGFFQPGRPGESAPAPAPRAQPAPQPRTAAAPQPPRPQTQAAPRPSPEPRSTPAYDDEAKKGGNGLVIGIVAVVALAVVGGGAFFFMNQQGGQGAVAWEQVDRSDPEALRTFIETATGDARSEAQAALRALENSAYEEARAANTIEALQAFLADFPDSEHSIAARGRIAELESLPPTPIEGELPPGELAPTDPSLTTTDPDLLPPTAVEPSTGSAPVPLTPPPAESEPLPEPGTETPTN